MLAYSSVAHLQLFLLTSPRSFDTFAPGDTHCSIFGPQDLVLLSFDEPDLFKRFSDVLGRAILARARVLDEEAGYTPETAPRGWSWADDNETVEPLRHYLPFRLYHCHDEST